MTAGAVAAGRVADDAPHSHRLVDAIALDIIAGKLAPGSKLDERQLAERFGVSRTPVREALRQLAVTGLVELASSSPTSTPPISPRCSRRWSRWKRCARALPPSA